MMHVFVLMTTVRLDQHVSGASLRGQVNSIPAETRGTSGTTTGLGPVGQGVQDSDGNEPADAALGSG